MMSDRIARFVIAAFSREGTITLATPDEIRRAHGRGSPAADMTIVDRAAYGRVARHGALGLAEAYLEGEIQTDDLQAMLIWGAENHARWGSGRAAAIGSPLRRMWQRLAPDRRHERVKTMVDHYDVGNDFYAAWLDATMTYSAARFSQPDGDLEAAQEAKYRAIAERAGLAPGMTVLEIGCGWGGFACFAAEHYGVHVTGLTISGEQAEYARRRVVDARLDERVEILIEDFRAHSGTYDAVVSIEMIESVDESVWPDLFQSFHDRVRPGGRGVMQAITIDDELFDGYRRRQDFIQRYIFPGGQVPARRVIDRLASAAGLHVASVETFGLDYARTLSMWMERFREAWPQISTHGLDERFRRMWEFYLAYCEAGFRTGAIDVGQWSFARP
jgi:cyclopropane-fatty-acyl-phospholipid synthase